jgi:hypothetical protein
MRKSTTETRRRAGCLKTPKRGAPFVTKILSPGKCGGFLKRKRLCFFVHFSGYRVPSLGMTELDVSGGKLREGAGCCGFGAEMREARGKA